MGWLIVEALAALGVLLFVVWWTVFSGRDEDRDGNDGEGNDGDPRRRG